MGQLLCCASQAPILAALYAVSSLVSMLAGEGPEADLIMLAFWIRSRAGIQRVRLGRTTAAERPNSTIQPPTPRIHH